MCGSGFKGKSEGTWALLGLVISREQLVARDQQMRRNLQVRACSGNGLVSDLFTPPGEMTSRPQMSFRGGLVFISSHWHGFIEVKFPFFLNSLGAGSSSRRVFRVSLEWTQCRQPGQSVTYNVFPLEWLLHGCRWEALYLFLLVVVEWLKSNHLTATI